MDMEFSHTNEGSGKAGKFMLVAALHVAIGALFIHAMNSRHISLSRINEQVLVMLDPQHVDPPPPLEPPPMPPELLPKVVPPTLVVAEPEVPVAPSPDAPPVHATTTPDPTPTTAGPAHAVPDAPSAGPQVKANAGQVRTAVLADPNACALPDYPPRAARDGTTGTTLLALLVGADGRVTSSRIAQSSGSRDLDRAAVNALSLCRFKPATNNGVAEAGWAQLAYVWTLD
jgi:protein TonB